MVRYTKLVFILISTLLANFSMIIIVPFYPIVANKRGIGELMIGLIFTMMPLFSCISSMYIGKNIERFGRRFISCLGIGLNSLGLIGIAFSNSLDNNGFTAVSLTSRAISGIGLACIYISNLSTISSEYSDKRESYTSMMEACGGIGLIFGPIYASVTYSSIGFSGSFFFLAIFLLFFLPPLWLFNAPTGTIIHRESRSLSRAKFSRNMALDLAILVYCYSIFSFLEPSFGIRLEERGLSESFIALVFTGLTIGYTLTNLLMGLLSRVCNVEKLVSASAGVCVVGVMLTGPIGSLFEGTFVSIIGMIMAPISAAMAFVTVLPSMIGEVSNVGLSSKGDIATVSSYFSMGINCGEIIGPLASGILSNMFHFNDSCIILGGIGILLILANNTMRNNDYSKRMVLLNNSEIEI